MGNRNRIPRAALDSQNHFIQLDTAYFLNSRACALVISAVITYRKRIFFGNDFKIIKTVL